MAHDRDVAAFGERAPGYENGWLGKLHHDIADRTADLALSRRPSRRMPEAAKASGREGVRPRRRQPAGSPGILNSGFHGDPDGSLASAPGETPWLFHFDSYGSR